MEQQNELRLEALLEKSKLKRRAILPWWIKFFIWIFMLLGAIALIAVPAGAAGMSYQASLYGMDAYEPFSLLGIINIILFSFKGLAAYGLWTEKDWAVNLAIIDALAGIIICTFMMFGLPLLTGDANFMQHLRIELALLVPFLLKLQKIRAQWSNY